MKRKEVELVEDAGGDSRWSYETQTPLQVERDGFAETSYGHDDQTEETAVGQWCRVHKHVICECSAQLHVYIDCFLVR